MASPGGPGLFGALLQQHRRGAGLSQEELAERCGLSRRGISDLERGTRRAPHPSTVRRLADALDLHPEARARLFAAAGRNQPETSFPPPHEHTTFTMPQPTTVARVQTFAQLLRSRRARAHLTQQALAARAGVSARAISDLERGVNRGSYPQTVARLLDALGLTESDRAVLQAAAPRDAWTRRSHPATFNAVSQPRHNLPAQLTSFVGRAKEVADIRRELARTRLLTLAGPGGVGKTRVALRVAEEEVETHADGAWFLDLAPISEPTLLSQLVANLFSVPENPGEPLIATLARAMQPLDVLLVLDNCEHLLAPCAQLVSRLLPQCPCLRVLATSRQPLGLMGAEMIWRVPPLSLEPRPGASVEGKPSHAEAAELFLERARSVQPAFAVTPSNERAFFDVCRRLDGIPLAIELAASHLTALGLEQMANRLASHFDFLTSKDPTAPGRQQTLEATIQWSYDLLTPEEQLWFDRLSVFAGGWSLEAMEALADDCCPGREDVLCVLERLADKSLVVVDAGRADPQRFRFLEPLRQYAKRGLQDRGELADTRARHALFFLHLFEQVGETVIRNGPVEGGFSRLAKEQDNLRVALRWFLDQRDGERAQRLAAAARHFWFYLGSIAEMRRWLEEALALDPTTDSSTRARVLIGIGQAAVHQGDLDIAEDVERRSLQLCQRLRDVAGVAWALTQLGNAARLRGDLGKARSLAEPALAAARASGHEAALAPSILLGLAEMDMHAGNLSEAQRSADQALKLATQRAFSPLICRASTIIGELHYRQGRPESARVLWEDALTRLRETHQKHTYMAATLIDLGRLANEHGDVYKARCLLAEGLVLAQELSRWDLARAFEAVVELAVSTGQAAEAMRIAGTAAAMRHAMRTPAWPTELARLETALRCAREQLSREVAQAAWTLGWTTPADRTLAIVLGLLQEPDVGVPCSHESPAFSSAAPSGP